MRYRDGKYTVLQFEEFMKQDLLPCPFCGGSGVFLVDSDIESCDKTAKVQCSVCRASTDFCGWLHDSAESAKEAATNIWNTRATGWISADERLPPVGVPVAVISKGLPSVGFHRRPGWRKMNQAKFTGRVTHWMSLPDWHSLPELPR